MIRYLFPTLSICCLSSNSGFSQENITNAANSYRNFMVILDGASNPELISEEALFVSLSGLLEGTDPDSCSDETQLQQVSATPPCLTIEGVDMSKAAQLAEEFNAHIVGVEHSHVTEFCELHNGRGVPYLSREEFAGEMALFLGSKSIEVSNFFLERGGVLLGQESLHKLVDWADNYLRKSIQEQKIDFAVFLEVNNLSPEQFSESFCGTNLSVTSP